MEFLGLFTRMGKVSLYKWSKMPRHTFEIKSGLWQQAKLVKDCATRVDQ